MAINDTFNTFRIAEKLSIPQLVQAIKNGSIDPNIGQLVLNNKMQQQKKLQGAMASGQQARPPIAQENMATGERMAGLGSMQSQQPMGFSSGGIVGYADGGEVQFPLDEATKRRLQIYGISGGYGDPAFPLDNTTVSRLRYQDNLGIPMDTTEVS